VAYAQELRLEVRHDHLKGGCLGVLVFDDRGASFEGRGHSLKWNYDEIQQLRLTPAELRVTTYRDSKWKLGGDRSYTFRGAFGEAYEFLRDRLDQRLVAGVADEDVRPLWEVPVKRLTRFGGSDGVLLVGSDRLVFQSSSASRTWRYSDIESVSSTGPFDLTVIGLERAYRFQLKRPLDESRYNELWRAIFLRRK
jgi:hypothetical protein